MVLEGSGLQIMHAYGACFDDFRRATLPSSYRMGSIVWRWREDSLKHIAELQV